MSEDTIAPFQKISTTAGATDWGGRCNYNEGENVCVNSLSGQAVNVIDDCGTGTFECSTEGLIDLDGVNGQHDCAISSGHSLTFAARSCLNEIKYMNQYLKNWLNLSWLNYAITCHVNINSTCSAFYSGNTINLYRSGGGCRNTGEIAAVFDHEWSHGVDLNDTAGQSNPAEAIADFGAAMRLHESCIGRGFFWTMNRGCEQWTNCPSNPGISYGYNCSGYASSECCLGCTGVRQIDYTKHADPDPETIQNFTCVSCSSYGSLGPCGRETHCEGIVPAEAAWDLAAIDLQTTPFNYDKKTAFLLATKIIWQGHNSVTNWYACTCPSTVNACGASNAHLNWLVADDDDGNISNGTPHASAIYTALNRHGIACTSASAVNSGCISGPNKSPVLKASAGDNNVSLEWTAVNGAANYYIFRTEGVKGCDFGEIKAVVSSTNFVDNEASNGRTYYYAVQAVGSNTDCLSPLSNCVGVTPSGVLPPGRVLNNLNINKSGQDLVLYWQQPGGSCVVNAFAIYKGTIPMTQYNHEPLDCNVIGTTYTIPSGAGSYYLLVVPRNANREGSYGLNSSGNEIPQAASPCLNQNLNPCN